MRTEAYTINRRIDAPVQFHGFKAQYIFYAGGIIVGEMFLFAIFYISGLSAWICLPLCGGSGALGLAALHRLSQRYGEFGWRKKRASRRIPKSLLVGSRQLFIAVKK